MEYIEYKDAPPDMQEAYRKYRRSKSLSDRPYEDKDYSLWYYFIVCYGNTWRELLSQVKQEANKVNDEMSRIKVLHNHNLVIK